MKCDLIASLKRCNKVRFNQFWLLRIAKSTLDVFFWGNTLETVFFKPNDLMYVRYEVGDTPITELFYCPHHPEHGVGAYKKESFDRKPNPVMILKAAEKYKIDLAQSIMIGDKDSDMQAANNAGVGVRCQYWVDEVSGVMSNAATDKTPVLRECISLLSHVFNLNVTVNM